MEFSGKDLEDIQRVAGLLGITVDELLRQRRPPELGIRPRHAASTIVADTSPQHSPVGLDGPVLLHHASAATPVIPDADEFGLTSPFSSPAVPETAHSASTSPDPAAAADVEPGAERVILLNPATAWYDCNAGLWDFEPIELDEISFAEGDAASSNPSATPMQLDTDSASEHTARDDSQGKGTDDVSTDWALVSSPGSLSSFAMVTSPSTGSLDKRYHLIAPKVSRSGSQPTSQVSSSGIRKKRSPYEGTKKTDTHLTRQVHACVRCRMQRNRCIPDPDNPRGPCLTCQQRTVRMSRLPCLRYMVTDSTLFRTGLDYMSFYKTHPMIGPHHGDFHLDRQWTDTASKFLCLGQVGSMYFKVELREFVPPMPSRDVDLKGRPMYAVPWAIADPDAVVEAMEDYIKRAIGPYMDAYLDDTDPLVWRIFQAAYRASVFPTPNQMVMNTLKLWVACRFIESKWRCWAEDGLSEGGILAANPQDPFYRDLTSLPPYLDYQIASIIIHRILSPLRKEVLRELQSTFNTHNPKDWFATFLTSFILLQNYEMQMDFQRQFAARRRAPVQYLDMPLVRATNSGAKTILAHFHYCYKGQQLFTKGFNWSAPRVRRMARLDDEQTTFMTQCRDLVVEKSETFQKINRTDRYHQQYWYTSQLFDGDWEPRDTLEHAPPVETFVG